jgi:hypothetical protein
VVPAVYGVVIGADGVTDEDATARRRLEIRTERLHGEPPRREPAPMLEYRSPLRVQDDSLCCNHCGEVLVGASGNWKAHASTRSWPLRDRAEHLGTKVRPLVDGEMRMWEFSCPACGTLLEVEIYEDGEEPAQDIFLGATSDVAGEPF